MTPLTLQQAYDKIQDKVNGSLENNVSNSVGRLMGTELFRRQYFAYQEAAYCTNVTQDTDRANTLLIWLTNNLP